MLPFFLVAPHVHVRVPLEAVGELVDQPGIAVEVEDNRLVRGEQAVELAVGRSVRMLGRRLQLEQIHHIDEAELQIRRPLAQDGRCRQRLHGGHVAAGRQHDIRFLARIGARPRPDAKALGAVRDRLGHRRELQVLLFVGNDDIDVVGAAKAMVGDRQQRVGVGRQVDARDRRPLVGHQIDEPRILMREPVVVLPPDGGRQQDVLGRDRGTPRHVVLADVQPLGVLVEHGIDDVRKRLVGVEEPVTPREQVALEPADQRVLRGISMTRPSRASSPPSASSGSMSAIQVFLLASYTACSRLDAVSSGPKTRKLVGLFFMTSRKYSPRGLVFSYIAVPREATSTA